MDKPISTPGLPAASPREQTGRRTEEGGQGAMSGRRVSESPPQAQFRTMRLSGEAGGTAGAVGAQGSIHSRQVFARAPVSGSKGARMELGLLGGADRPPGAQEPVTDFVAAYGRLRDFRNYYAHLSRSDIAGDCRRAADRVHKSVLSQFRKFGGKPEELTRTTSGGIKAEQAYRSLQATASQAERGGDRARADAIREALAAIDKGADEELRTLTAKHGLTAVPPTRSTLGAPATVAPAEPIAAIPPPVSVPGAIDWCIAHRQVRGLQHHFAGIGQSAVAEDFFHAARRMGDFVRRRYSSLGGKFDDLPPVRRGSSSSRPEQMYRALEAMAQSAERSRSVKQAGKIREALRKIERAASGELEILSGQHGSIDELAKRANLPGQRPPVLVGPAETSIAVPVAVGPPPQTVQQVTVPVAVPFDPGIRPAGEAVQPQLVIATPTVTAAASPAPLLDPPWLEDDYAVERALIAGELPPGFDASGLIVEAGQFEQFGLATELAAGRLPLETIAILIEGFRITDEDGGNALFIEYLVSLNENIQRALDDAYPQRVDPDWLDQVRLLLRRRSESSPRGAVARSPEPDPWSAPPGPSSRLLPARTSPAPVEAPGAQTPDFGRPAAQSPVSKREAIAERFKSVDAWLDAEVTLQTGGGSALGWSATRSRVVLDNLYRLHKAALRNPAAAAALDDIDWSAIDALAGILDVPARSP